MISYFIPSGTTEAGAMQQGAMSKAGGRQEQERGGRQEEREGEGYLAFWGHMTATAVVATVDD